MGQHLFNSFPETYREGDFLLHFAGRADREALMAEASARAK